MFALSSANSGIAILLDQRGIGSHALIYTEAARAWLQGGNPWVVGPPAAIFAGPPPMLLLFVPFVGLPADLVRVFWVVASAAAAIWALRRLGLPGYWIGFPPILQAIHLGHPETLILMLIVAGGVGSGAAVLIKPYAALPLLAERRWSALILAAVALVVTAPILPWSLFLDQLPTIASNVALQAQGDSVFGQPILMLVAVGALATLGLRRALWLATPLLWPSAQPMYKVMTVPMLSPVLAIFWALPIPGATLAGIVTHSTIVAISRRRILPSWALSAIDPDAMRGPSSNLRSDHDAIARQES